MGIMLLLGLKVLDYESKIWKSLSYHIKSLANLEVFKTIIKNWDGVSRSCPARINWYLAAFVNFQTFKIIKLCFLDRYF